MAPIHEAYLASPEWQEITLKAYPPPVVQKKQKKVKDRGSRHPFAAGKEQQVRVDGPKPSDEAQ
jgi:tyrosyl-tRNA synthetase